MKKTVTAVFSILLCVLLLCPVLTPVLAEDGETGGDGLYTPIPYVPKYSGELSSQSRVLLMDLATGNVLIEQNSDVRAYPASTTKIMTAVLFIENTKDDEWDDRVGPLTEVNSVQSAKGSQFGLKVGDQPTRRDLLYGLLLPSGCDCAYVISCLLAGSEADFVFMMNNRAAEIGMGNSGYENSYGLASNGHYTTAEDMAILIRHAMQYPIFRSTIATAHQTLYIPNNGSVRTVFTSNTNHLIRRDLSDYYPYAIGVKTGTSGLADHCLTAAARKGGLEILSIILNSEDNAERYGFTKEILEWGFDYYASEGGLYSMAVTNALFRAAEGGCGVYAVPETSAESNPSLATVAAGDGVRVGAYHYDSDGKLWYMVWHEGAFRWAKSEELEFVSYVNDIRIETSSELNGVAEAGEDKPIDGVISSRHTVRVVTLTVYDSSGTPMTGGSNYPSASCTHTLFGTTVDQDADIGILPPGDYTCVTKVEAEAFVPDAPDSEFIVSEEVTHLRIVESGAAIAACAISYNSNTGTSAPEGGFAEKGGSFTVTDDVPEKPGCEFVSWNTAADGSGTTYMPGDTIAADEDVTLYAVWGKAESRWTEDADAAFEDGKVTLSGAVANNAGITKAEITIAPAGGASEPVFTKEICGAVNSLELADFNKELADIAFEEGSYVLTVHAAAGVSQPETVVEKEFAVSYKTAYSLLLRPEGGKLPEGTGELTVYMGEAFGSLPLPLRDGYEFSGWSFEDGSPVKEDTVVPESESGTITLRANWTAAGGQQGEDGGSGDTPAKKKNHVPLWVWFAGGLLLVAVLIGLMIFIVKKPAKDEE